jgi:hypothetical protein
MPQPLTQFSDPAGELLHRSLATGRAVTEHETAFEELIAIRRRGGSGNEHRRQYSWVTALRELVFLEAALLTEVLADLDVPEERKPALDSEVVDRVRLMRNLLVHAPEVRTELDSKSELTRSARAFEERYGEISFAAEYSPEQGTTTAGVRLHPLREFAARTEELAWSLIPDDD